MYSSYSARLWVSVSVSNALNVYRNQIYLQYNILIVDSNIWVICGNLGYIRVKVFFQLQVGIKNYLIRGVFRNTKGLQEDIS
ncbi:hypothetical protein FGO68_gene6104 [Halteria grandinella]|uniref:Uncharacterized protein n=1 Tax=Halteria grandinella TaxID=5974 RepID=A0A8J8NSJ6_HALGN|nr:hypothetical protein FGO68_gene6104 [Halteria grandinella]